MFSYLLFFRQCGRDLCMEVLALPVRHSQEHCNDQCSDELEVVGIDLKQSDNALNHDVVNDRTHRHRQKLDSEVTGDLAEYDTGSAERRTEQPDH